jgi:hypothetical protein
MVVCSFNVVISWKCVMCGRLTKWEPPYLYFGDYDDIEMLRREEVDRYRDKLYKIPIWIKKLFGAW